MTDDIKTIVLAAGKGTRMNSKLPKVMHEIFGKPLIGWVLDIVNRISYNKENIVVLGHGSNTVKTYLDKTYDNVQTVMQLEQLGTGHAVAQALPLLKDYCGQVLITCGDTPMLQSSTLENFVKFHIENEADLTILTAKFDNPYGYGRIVRNERYEIVKVVEEKDATNLQKTINEVNAGVYCLNWKKIESAFSELQNDNAQGEYYLTDIIKWAKNQNLKVIGYTTNDNQEITGINSRYDLSSVSKSINFYNLYKLMNNGVTIVDMDSTFISPDTEIEQDTIVYPCTFINGKNKIAKNCKIGPNAHIRGNCEIGEGCKIGNFVELKNAKIAKNTNVCHLSYVGDAKLGENVNIGAGTIFANYNSITKEKKESTLSNNVSVGSNSVIVAPVEIQENAFIAASTTVTKNVEANSLAMSRTPQKEIKDWVKTEKGEN